MSGGGMTLAEAKAAQASIEYHSTVAGKKQSKPNTNKRKPKNTNPASKGSVGGFKGK